jgi:hypothetical protein
MSGWRHGVRYVERWDPDAPQGSAPFHYGVWDEANRDWVARGLTGPVAGMHAAVLSLRFERSTERLDDAARWVDQPVHVELTISPTTTEVALLHMWAREQDGWHGYVTYLERHPLNPGRWAHASALRPLTQGEINAFTKRPAVPQWHA